MSRSSSRDFNVPDAEIVGAARTFCSIYERYSAEFIAFNSVKFSPDFLDGFKAVIDEAGRMGQHSDVLHNISVETQEVIAAKEAATECYGVLRFTVETAWPKDPAAQNVFGTHDFNSLKRGPVEKFILFLLNVEPSITTNWDSLAAAGYTAEKHAAYTASVAALASAKSVQDDSIRGVQLKTRARSTIMNEIHDTMVAIRKAAKQIFKGKPEIIALFTIPAGVKEATVAEVSETK